MQLTESLHELSEHPNFWTVCNSMALYCQRLAYKTEKYIET